jgi:2-dehydropantoate 2-reductase
LTPGPRILVYGAGGVGAFFGALLARAGCDVRFVARGAQLDALRSHGIRIRSALLGDVEVPAPAAYLNAAEAGQCDLVLVCVKTHQTAAILDDLSSAVAQDTVLVTFQNGVESDEVLAERFGRGRVLPAVVYVGATVEEPGVVRHAAPAKVSLGARPGFDPARVAGVRDVLAASGQPVQISDDIQRERWRKLIWNASFNSVSAVTLRTPGELLALPAARGLLVAIMREVVSVAQALGVDLRESDIDEHVAWTERAAAMRTSTMVDRERGRTMEADALVGVIVRRGEQAGVSTPACRAMYALMVACDAQPGAQA